MHSTYFRVRHKRCVCVYVCVCNRPLTVHPLGIYLKYIHGPPYPGREKSLGFRFLVWWRGAVWEGFNSRGGSLVHDENDHYKSPAEGRRRPISGSKVFGHGSNFFSS